MISCADFIAEISNYVDNDVAAEVRTQVESHLAHCRSCQVVFDSTRKTVRIVTDSGCFDFPETSVQPVLTEVMQRIRDRKA